MVTKDFNKKFDKLEIWKIHINNIKSKKIFQGWFKEVLETCDKELPIYFLIKIHAIYVSASNRQVDGFRTLPN